MEIIVKNPQLNDWEKRHRRFSYEIKGAMISDYLARNFEARKIDPITHPKVIDLYSGDAPMAKHLSEFGWNPGDITCVDIMESPEPLVENLKWQYINLDALVITLRLCEESSLPKSVREMKGKFDLVTCNRGSGSDKSDEELLAKYFAKPETGESLII